MSGLIVYCFLVGLLFEDVLEFAVNVFTRLTGNVTCEARFIARNMDAE